jgi:hypothetical protein
MCPELADDCLAILRPGDARAARQALVRTSGQGSRTEPLRLASVLRHADWADEAGPPEVLVQVRQVLDALWVGLVGVDLGRELTDSLVDELRTLIKGANPVATAAGTYFSGAVIVLSGSQLAIAAIGDVEASRWHRGLSRTLLQASVQRMHDRPSDAGLLTAALGLGFNPNAISSSVHRMAPDEFAVLLVGARLADEVDHDPPAQSSGWVSAPTRLRQIRDRLELGVGVVAVLVPCAGLRPMRPRLG